MCDDFTAVADDTALAKKGMNRRQFAAMGAAAVGALGIETACAAQDGPAGLSEASVTITTPDGTCDGFFVHPADGKHPAVIMWPDIAGLRPAFQTMARNLAARGYAVLAVNQYYRSAKAPVMQTISEFFAPEGRAKLGPMIQKITVPGIMADSKAFVAWLDAQDAVDATKKIGVEGYCMTGGYTVRTAAAVPDRVNAGCSFHGAAVVTDAPDSPHKQIADTKANFLFAIARNDDARSPTDKTVLAKVAEQTGRGIRAEVFHADHGWCVPDSPVYDPEEANRARELGIWIYQKS